MARAARAIMTSMKRTTVWEGEGKATKSNGMEEGDVEGMEERWRWQ